MDNSRFVRHVRRAGYSHTRAFPRKLNSASELTSSNRKITEDNYKSISTPVSTHTIHGNDVLEHLDKHGINSL